MTFAIRVDVNWIEFIIVYLAIGCAIAAWLLYREDRKLEIVSNLPKFFINVVAWPISLAFTLFEGYQSFSNVPQDDGIEDAQIEALFEAVLSNYPSAARSADYFEFRDDLERYIGLSNVFGVDQAWPEDFYSIEFDQPSEIQRQVLNRNHQRLVRSHLERSRQELLDSVSKIPDRDRSKLFLANLEKIFRQYDDKHGLRIIETGWVEVEAEVDSHQIKQDEYFPWIQEEKMRS